MNKETITFKPSWWAKLFQQVPRSYQYVTLELADLKIQTASKYDVIPYDKVVGVKEVKRLFWSRVHLSLSSETTIVLGGLRPNDAKKLCNLFLSYQANFHNILEFIDLKTPEISDFHSWLKERRDGNYWVSRHDIECAIAKQSDLSKVLRLIHAYLTKNHTIKKMIPVIDDFFSDPEKFRILSNEIFLPLELDRFKDYFDTVEDNPLTFSQKQAIVTHEDNTRVIAGAGSGKTSVIVAKAGYLIEKGIYNEDEILLIAFNRSAADEMAERIEKRIQANIRATTFHALGLGIIAEVEGEKPLLAKIAENDRALKQKIQDILIELIKDENTTHLVATYFQSFFAPYKSEFEFDSLGDYYRYVRDNELITLKGERLRSFEEVEIANFLFIKGVEYQYERPYEVNTATITHRRYEPDFYLIDYGIYIEHFGIRRDGSTAPYVNQKEYIDGMIWKRQVHKDNSTTLIETYSYEKAEGTLLVNLKNKLLEQGVDLVPINSEILLKTLNEIKIIKPLTNLTVTFLNHFKGGCYSINEVREQADVRGILNPRLDAFLLIFQRVLESYERHLGENLDFNDMINSAVDYVEDNSYRSPYKCILVDEFQDISTNRAKLIKTLSQQEPSHRLFCVGDDWQAIYRFAGSDISIMREFSRNFGFTETVALDRTFRFNDRIEAVATKFVLENPAQIKRAVVTTHKAHNPRIVIHRPERKSDDVFIEVLEEINRRSNYGQHNVLCLGRYNYLKDGLSWSKAKEQFGNLKITFRTVHSAKGSEKDYVIVLGMRSGKYGFPSEITDDPILDAVLSEPESYPHAEERRLFYVALTRARHAVHLIVDYSSPSCFISEIKTYKGLVESLGAAGGEAASCPSCKTGELIQRTSPYGIFYGCQNYPLCNYKVDACVRCGIGVLVLDKIRRLYKCNNVRCQHTERQCPSCKSGRLVERNGPYGAFFGCTNYHSGQCSYTEDKMKSIHEHRLTKAYGGHAKWRDV